MHDLRRQMALGRHRQESKIAMIATRGKRRNQTGRRPNLTSIDPTAQSENMGVDHKEYSDDDDELDQVGPKTEDGADELQSKPTSLEQLQAKNQMTANDPRQRLLSRRVTFS